MPTPEQRIAELERQLRALTPQVGLAYRVAAALEGRQADATLSLPHNDSWLFEDNVDATHPANLRYIIAANTQRIVSARLSIHLAAFRTYNSLSLTATGNESNGHNHGHAHTSAAHTHSLHIVNGASAANLAGLGAGGNVSDNTAGAAYDTAQIINSTTPGNTGSDSSGESATHTHTVSGTAVLGVTEGAVATGVTIAFDGVDHTAALGGPFNADVVELNVAPFVARTPGIWHTIAMQPSGLGRIEAHLRLGVYVSAAQPI